MKKLFFAALVAASLPSHAEFKSGNSLYEQMKSSSTLEQMNALGYVTGVADVLSGALSCHPANVTAGQLNDMVLKYMENYPATRNFTADLIVQRVLSSTWPCEKKGQRL